MPILEFTFAGQTEPIKLGPWAYSFSAVMIDDELITNPCTVAITGEDSDVGLNYLGASFLRNYVVSYNFKDNTITLGKSMDAP